MSNAAPHTNKFNITKQKISNATRIVSRDFRYFNDCKRNVSFHKINTKVSMALVQTTEYCTRAEVGSLFTQGSLALAAAGSLTKCKNA